MLENNYTYPVRLKDLAYLSGRSLSSFKRDCNSTYRIPPSEWIREKRLARVRELLTSTEMKVTDICFASGFEKFSISQDCLKNVMAIHHPTIEKIEEVCHTSS